MKNKWSCIFLAGFLAVGIVFTGCSNQTSGGSTTAAAQESGTTAASATTESVSAVTTSAAVETSVSVAETVVGNDQLEVQLLGYVSEHGDWEPDKIHNFHHEEDHDTHYHCSFDYGNCQYECYVDTSSGEVTDCHHIDEEEGRHHAESEHESAHSHESHHSDHHDE